MEEIIAANVKDSSKQILMPKARKFDDLFVSATVVTDLSARAQTSIATSKVWHVDELINRSPFVRKGTGRAGLCTFCSVRGADGKHRYLDVTPKPEIFDLVEQHMMLGDGYYINFEIIAYDDGTALVTAHYNVITGSRWFAFIDASTIPG